MNKTHPQKRIALVTKLTSAKLKRLGRLGCFDEIGYIDSPLPHEELQRLSHLCLIQFNFKDSPFSYHDYMKKVYDWVERLFKVDSYAKIPTDLTAVFGLKESCLLNALKKSVALCLEKDAKLVTLGEQLFSAYRRTYFVSASECFEALKPQELRWLPDSSVKEPLKLATNYAFYWLFLLGKILLPSWHKKTSLFSSKWIVDLTYAPLAWGGIRNPEFDAFYRYFKTREDILYSCAGAQSELYKFLKEQDEPVIVYHWHIRGILQKVKVLRHFFVLTFKKKLPLFLRFELLKLFKWKLYYESLFCDLHPRFFLKVRSDAECFHPIATAVAEQHTVGHVGYSCGSYPFFSFLYAWIDFHYYGLLGWRFKEIFNGVWSDSNNYVLLGPFTAEIQDPSPRKKPDGRIVIGAFTTTVDDDIWAQKAFLQRFIESVCLTAQKFNGQVIFKLKRADPDTHSFIAAYCNGKIDYHTASYRKDGIRAQEVIEQCDIVAVMGASTTAWETLGRRKKLVILEQPGLPHPFDSHPPHLVARSHEEFLKIFSWLLGIGQSDYEKALDPLLKAWAKPSDGNLVKDFIESIELEGQSINNKNALTDAGLNLRNNRDAAEKILAAFAKDV